jgi:arabinofuranosyltransferase
MTTEAPGADDTPHPPARGRRWAGEAAAAALLVFFAWSVWRNAWVCDDAYITFRSSCNWLIGNGPVYNVGERVQTYTHPLWMLLLTGLFALTHEVFYSTIALSTALSVAALALLCWGGARTPSARLLMLTAALFSKGMIEYAASGLENPMTFLLLAAFVASARSAMPARRRLPWMALAMALGLLNRLDAALLFAPPLAWTAWIVWRNRREHGARALARTALACAPLLAWEAFSLIYYGFFVPNTAPAKLFSGIPTTELWIKGAQYLASTTLADPVLILVLVAGIAAGLRSRTGLHRALAAGAALYVLYLVHIGGDFMKGRLLTPPTFVALALLARLADPATRRRYPAIALTALILALGMHTLVLLNFSPNPYPLSNMEYIDRWGFSDERAFHEGASSRRFIVPGHELTRCWWLDTPPDPSTPPQVELTGMAGTIGFKAGPQVSMIDTPALLNPLMARLPALREPTGWRPGHLYRRIPAGLFESERTGENRLADPALAALYDDLRSIARDPIWSARRWAAIRRVHLGEHDGRIDRAFYSDPANQALPAPEP